MGIFDWLMKRKSNVEVLTDVVWLTSQAKFSGISAATARYLVEPVRTPAVLLVAVFPDCLRELHAVVNENGFDQQAVVALLAEQMAGHFARAAALDESQTLEILVAERHPLQAHNGAIVEFAQSLPCRCRLVHHMSLEDPMMQPFVGESAQGVLKRLGIDEQDAIESRMVGRHIRKALQEIEHQTLSDLPADSSAEWLRLNCPGFSRDVRR